MLFRSVTVFCVWQEESRSVKEEGEATINMIKHGDLSTGPVLIIELLAESDSEMAYTIKGISQCFLHNISMGVYSPRLYGTYFFPQFHIADMQAIFISDVMAIVCVAASTDFCPGRGFCLHSSFSC